MATTDLDPSPTDTPEPPALDLPDGGLLGAIVRMDLAVTRVLEEHAGRSGLTFADYLVLGVVRGQKLHHAIEELRRVIAPGGLVFLVENTTAKPSLKQIEFRTIAEYADLVDFARLRHLHDYEDLGETISVLAGRAP